MSESLIAIDIQTFLMFGAYSQVLDFELDQNTVDQSKTVGVTSSVPDHMGRSRHTIVCKHWLRDLCMKGEKCDFLHLYDLERMPECVQFSKFGRCADRDCDFKHVTDRAQCQRYRFGFCRLGHGCKLRHDRLPRGYLPEVVPDWFLSELCPNLFERCPRLDSTQHIQLGLSAGQEVAYSGVNVAEPNSTNVSADAWASSSWSAEALPSEI